MLLTFITLHFLLEYFAITLYLIVHKSRDFQLIINQNVRMRFVFYVCRTLSVDKKLLYCDSKTV